MRRFPAESEEHMNLSEALSLRIELLCFEKDLTLYELSKKSGVPRTTLKDIVAGRITNTGIKNVEKIAGGFGMNIRDFFDADLFEKV